MRAQDRNARRRMGREVETMQRVRSPHVAEVLDADLDGEPPYIVTRYVPGLPLDDVVGAGGPLTGPALARLACGLAEALAAVHAAGVVHRDLKPGNVMISDGEPVVIDFGIAQLPETTRLTLTGMFMGTPGYLAPEVIEGKDSGTASDVHSWGATVAFAASGRPPYGTGPYETIFYRIMHGAPDLDTLPDPLRAVVLAALARDPARRPSAAELGQQVAAIDPAALIPDRPTITRPMTTSSPSDVRDLLPPVSYQPAGQPGPGGQPAGRYPAAPAGLAAGAGLANGADLAHGAGQAAGAGQPGGAGLAGRPDPFGSWLPGEPAGHRHRRDDRRGQRHGAGHRHRDRARRAGRAARRGHHRTASGQAAGRRRRRRTAAAGRGVVPAGRAPRRVRPAAGRAGGPARVLRGGGSGDHCHPRAPAAAGGGAGRRGAGRRRRARAGLVGQPVRAGQRVHRGRPQREPARRRLRRGAGRRRVEIGRA